jgi:hypothetical protein
MTSAGGHLGTVGADGAPINGVGVSVVSVPVVEFPLWAMG